MAAQNFQIYMFCVSFKLWMPLQSFDEKFELLTKQRNPSILLLLPHSWHLFIVKWLLSPCRNVMQSRNVKLLKVLEKNKWFFN